MGEVQGTRHFGDTGSGVPSDLDMELRPSQSKTPRHAYLKLAFAPIGWT